MDIGKRPHKVALVCLEGGNEGAALGLVLDDMAAAGPVYERLCHVKEPIEFARLDPSDANALSTCDSFVMAFAGKKDAEASALAVPIPAGSPRYAVCDRAPEHPGWSGALVVDDLDGVARSRRHATASCSPSAPAPASASSTPADVASEASSAPPPANRHIAARCRAAPPGDVSYLTT